MLRLACVLLPSLLFINGCGKRCDDGSTRCANPGDMATAAARCSAPAAVACSDSSILDLSFQKSPSPDTRLVTNTAEGAGWKSEIDAAAGGMSPRESYVYARFTATGLEKVAIGDEAALESMGWDIAFRRFIVRLNSGVSGPSCVDGARTAANTDFDALTAEPAELEYRTEAYYTESCELVPDGSGLGSPGTALQSFWRYPGCVQMTGNVFVVRLADGRKVKLVVSHYYEPSVQEYCDANDMISPGDSGAAAKVGVRWAFLDQ